MSHPTTRGKGKSQEAEGDEERKIKAFHFGRSAYTCGAATSPIEYPSKWRGLFFEVRDVEDAPCLFSRLHCCAGRHHVRRFTRSRRRERTMEGSRRPGTEVPSKSSRIASENIVLVIGVCLRSYHRRTGAATAGGIPGDLYRLAIIASIEKGGDGRTGQCAREYRQQ